MDNTFLRMLHCTYIDLGNNTNYSRKIVLCVCLLTKTILIGNMGRRRLTYTLLQSEL